MKRKVMIIGIGAGNPDFVTIQAIDAMNRVDVFFIPDKGAEKAELSRVRRLIIDRYVRERPFRTIEYRVPSRRRAAESYESDVAAWHAEIGEGYRRMILERLSETEIGAFLVWGDPTLYDSTLRILQHLRAEGGFELDYDVIPGISSVQALAAQHRVAINEIGRAVLITNGRELAEGFPNNVDSVVVLLNADKALRSADGELRPIGSLRGDAGRNFGPWQAQGHRGRD
jgi:precorrin-6A synthase